MSRGGERGGERAAVTDYTDNTGQACDYWKQMAGPRNSTTLSSTEQRGVKLGGIDLYCRAHLMAKSYLSFLSNKTMIIPAHI